MGTGMRTARAMSGRRPLAAALLALSWQSLDIATAAPVEMPSAARHFQLRVTGIDRHEPLNRLHGFDLSVQGRSGEPVNGATVSVSGERRFTANPLPTVPRLVAGPQPGTYRGEGLRFHMPGAWRLVIEVEWGQIRDRATLDIVVK